MGADEQKDIEEQEAMSGHKAIDGTLIASLPQNVASRVLPHPSTLKSRNWLIVGKSNNANAILNKELKAKGDQM